ncbi:uncharacterized protein LOC132069188 [Lycium ferocissimum]|uniref:uncharacterized protein LOC132069188 n=1 Tax=Lycium ferocissimum TaxID=112874 RepID=UPI0028169C88|nr:uncharacterized protein LOC132069188 [Lycium ferocissimum]
MNTLMSRPYYAYSKMEIEDPEEVQHRRAQFLIHKSLQKSDSIGSQRRQPIWLKVKVCKLKIKIGRRLKRIRKSMLLKFSATKGHVVYYKQLICQLKYWKRLIKGRETAMAKLPPMFT